MTNWSEWNTTCRCGYSDPKSRTRSILHQPYGNGSSCPPEEETTNCMMEPCNCQRDKPGYHGDRCEDRDCQWSMWSAWSTCMKCSEKYCDYDQYDSDWVECPNFAPRKTRNRTVEFSQEGAGEPCVGSVEENDSCGYKCKLRCYTLPKFGPHSCKYKQG